MLYVLMLGVSIREFVELLNLALNSLEQLLRLCVARREGGLDLRRRISSLSERASVGSSLLRTEG